ncbi:MAG: hypothetical protein N4A46_10815, partial [Schleiferiaceae bacterium]|nr:hypothetical protein [Schleiferiaceae bacterium]
ELTNKNGSLLHSYKEGESKIDGFLEDYALLTQAYISLYEVCGEELWLQKATRLAQICRDEFKDPNSSLFYFTNNTSETLVAKSIEKEDNVIPSSNAVLATSFFKLGLLNGQPELNTLAEEMLQHMHSDLTRYPEGYTQWGQLLLNLIYPYYEVAVAGKGSGDKVLQMRRNEYYPNILWAFGDKENNVDLLQDRWMDGATYIFVCQNQSCQMPTEDVNEALKLLKFD